MVSKAFLGRPRRRLTARNPRWRIDKRDGTDGAADDRFGFGRMEGCVARLKTGYGSSQLQSQPYITFVSRFPPGSLGVTHGACCLLTHLSRLQHAPPGSAPLQALTAGPSSVLFTFGGSSTHCITLWSSHSEGANHFSTSQPLAFSIYSRLSNFSPDSKEYTKWHLEVQRESRMRACQRPATSKTRPS